MSESDNVLAKSVFPLSIRIQRTATVKYVQPFQTGCQKEKNILKEKELWVYAYFKKVVQDERLFQDGKKL